MVTVTEVRHFWDRSRANFFSSLGHSEEISCPGCYGSGVQRNTQTGLNVMCPICLGTGKARTKTIDIVHRGALRI